MAALTAHALARELLALPDKPVRVVIYRAEVAILNPAGRYDYRQAYIAEDQARPAEIVRHEGAYILIRGE